MSNKPKSNNNNNNNNEFDFTRLTVRQLVGLTLEQVAQQTNLSIGLLSSLERGTVTTIKTLLKRQELIKFIETLENKYNITPINKPISTTKTLTQKQKVERII